MESLLSLVQWCSMLALFTAAGAPEPPPVSHSAQRERPASASVTIKPGDLSIEIASNASSNPSARPWTGKLWLDNFATYANSRETRGQVIGQSRQISFSFAEAQRRANVDAARQVYDRLRSRLHPWLRDGDERQWIVESIAQD